MSDAELRTAEVDLSGLMTVLGEHLYSTPLVAIRELVQNAHDSCTRRTLEDTAEGARDSRILLKVDRARRMLIVTDTGAGMTRDEIVRYLATVGSGYTRQLREKTGDESLIGLFGLGFLSAFVIAESVNVWTTSFREPAVGNRYKSRSAETYTLEHAPARLVGTEVELTVKPKFADLLDEGELHAVLGRYCALLPHPIFIGDASRPINGDRPPWRAEEGRSFTLAARERLAFAARFEKSYEPLSAWDVAPSKDTDLRGIIWVQSEPSYGMSDNRNVAVFVRGMLLDDDARELLPTWAGFCGAVLESSRLTPTASREDLQKDDQYRIAQRVLAESVVRGLADMAKHEPEAWQRVLLRHNDALLGGAVADDRLFHLLFDSLTVPTSEGDMTLGALTRAGNGTVHVALSRRGGFEEILFRALKVPIVAGTRFAVVPFLRKCTEHRNVNVVHLGTAEGDKQVFRTERISEDKRQWLQKMLAGAGHTVVPTRFDPKELPLVLVPDQEVLLKKRIESDEANKKMAGAVLRLARIYTSSVDDTVVAKLYVNLDSPAIGRLLALSGDAERARTGADLLRAIAALTAGSGEASSTVDVPASLAAYTAAVCRVLGDDQPTKTP